MLDDYEIELKRYKDENQVLVEEKKNLEKVSFYFNSFYQI